MNDISTVATAEIWETVFLSLRLAGITTILLLLITTPLAWWLSHTRNRFKAGVEAIVALPIVLPPTVLGFYLLIVMGPQGLLGGISQQLTGEPLSFTFTGLVIASMLYSMPFVVQPLQSAFESVGRQNLETAWSLRASKLDTFFTVVSPLALRGYVTAAVLGFTHTLGEFGVILMVGGNIPGETRVLSIAIYDHVETLDYATAHTLAAGLLVFSFVVLLLVYIVNQRYRVRSL